MLTSPGSYCGVEGIGKQEIASRWAAHAGRLLLACDLRQRGGKDSAEDLIRRAQREALLNSAVLYVGPFAPDALSQGTADMTRRLADYPGMVILGIESTQPPRLKLERPLREIGLHLPSEPVRMQIRERQLPAEVRAYP